MLAFRFDAEALRHISNYLRTLAYEDTPDYNHIQGWLAQLPDVLQPTHQPAEAMSMPPPAWSGAAPPSSMGQSSGFPQMPFASQFVANGSYFGMQQPAMQGWGGGVLADTPASPPADTPASPPAAMATTSPSQQPGQHDVHGEYAMVPGEYAMIPEFVPESTADAGAAEHAGVKRSHAEDSKEQAAPKRTRHEASTSQQR